MKTKIRVTKSNPTRSTVDNYEYQHLSFQFLYPRYDNIKESQHLEVAFEMRWQITTGHENWYGLTFVCETDNIKHVEYMAKVLSELKKADLYYTDKLPEVIANILGCEKYVYDQGMFVPYNLTGCKVFRIMKNGNCWTIRHCFTEQQAIAYMESIMGAGKHITADNWSVELMIPRVDFKMPDYTFDV